MKTRLTNQRTSRFSFAIGMAMLVGGALGARAADASVAPIADPPVDIAAPAVTLAASSQLSSGQISSADLGLAMPLVSSNVVVHFPEAQVAGPEGVDAFIASLGAEFPAAQFQVTSFQSIGNLIVIDWQGIQDDIVVFPGRTLATIKNGTISEIHFLNTNALSPVDQSENSIAASVPIQTATTEGFFVIVDEQGNAVIPESIVDNAVAAAGIEARGWPDFDPSSLADVAKKVEAAGIEAQGWPDFDPTSLP